MKFLDSVLRRNKELESMFDLDLFYEMNPRKYLKQMALETCINFIGRTISQSDFRISKNGERIYNDWHYLLNVRPNTDQSASDFWQSFVYKLIYENEVLVILSDNNDLLIADDFDREEFAVYPDVFRNVTVKGYTFKRTYQMDEVIHVSYNNEKLTKFMDGMFGDYADLFTRMIETNKHSNQIRGTVSVDTTQNLEEENRTRLQEFIDRLFNSIRKNAVAIIPKLKGFEYTEVAGGDKAGRSVEELAKLKRDLINHVANILGIPTSLIHGEMSEYETGIKAYVKFCSGPLVKKIKDELNAKLITKPDYMDGEKIDILGVAELNPLEVANSVDKLRASGVYNGNEIRIKLGDEPVDNPALEEYVLTKNYQRAADDSTGGGENK
ncbi:phage portal protein [Paenibacillus sp. JCM 10914]|uniref:phage portal protein n=1 Tax=Paenibacillus sp. JCM 10914 TaxID=1236974 RepID=UPI0003CC362A|nr:phage portal protein [Paenibacillus sp. JCM 10914]GAE09616.1 portal protein, phage associated [Paenibacillus sp. JCM 10914]